MHFSSTSAFQEEDGSTVLCFLRNDTVVAHSDGVTGNPDKEVPVRQQASCSRQHQVAAKGTDCVFRAKLGDVCSLLAYVEHTRFLA